MKFTSIVLAAGLLAAPAIALAQSSPSPNNTSGPGVNASTPAPTEQGAAATSGNTKAIPARPTMSKSKMKKSRHMATRKSNRMTTGAAMRDTKKKNASPASAAEGVEKEK
ncbi:MAG TPA: hypothetical protein VGV41_16610 [Pseudolabrys sp.]|jgi:hypothetical protein|uniref:hypothetical protein n=1 Tax=Pseudolabrys sp. TaxID=1960880 RepID=UPI002DDCE697|nr:hypothetical protein [Pseudolabrys sp.]HEV2630254.1 hypothetical protein [Pseudolabrys sp.]